MAFVSLSRRDINVLEKIKDPESDPTVGPLIDSSLPKDPHVRDAEEYENVSRREQEIVRSIQQLEVQIAALQAERVAELVAAYRECLSRLGALISEHPRYASARNNRAQAIRRLYGDGMLLRGENIPRAEAIIPNAPDDEQEAMAGLALSDLDAAIELLSPATPFAPLSPQAARTLSMAHTQRAALYHRTARLFPHGRPAVGGSGSSDRPEAAWARLEFEEAASRDFALGGRYGSDIAKGLAVGTNPTAKLCGEMVREAMRKEYGPDYAS